MQLFIEKLDVSLRGRQSIGTSKEHHLFLDHNYMNNVGRRDKAHSWHRNVDGTVKGRRRRGIAPRSVSKHGKKAAGIPPAKVRHAVCHSVTTPPEICGCLYWLCWMRLLLYLFAAVVCDMCTQIRTSLPSVANCRRGSPHTHAWFPPHGSLDVM